MTDRRELPSRSAAGNQIAPLLTIAEVAELLRTSEQTVRRLVAARRIPCLRIGRQIRFVPGDVFRWLEARKE